MPSHKPPEGFEFTDITGVFMDRESTYLVYIKTFLASHGVPPTVEAVEKAKVDLAGTFDDRQVEFVDA